MNAKSQNSFKNEADRHNETSSEMREKAQIAGLVDSFLWTHQPREGEALGNLQLDNAKLVERLQGELSALRAKVDSLEAQNQAARTKWAADLKKSVEESVFLADKEQNTRRIARRSKNEVDKLVKKNKDLEKKLCEMTQAKAAQESASLSHVRAHEDKLARLEKEKAEAVALAERGKRECLQRELESLSRWLDVQRLLLEKLNGKPITSSGLERASADPPPTIITTMAGPSYIATEQPDRRSIPEEIEKLRVASKRKWH